MNLNFKEFGQGDPIIILHGLFGMLDNWQTLAKQFAENYSVYILDQRNHGKSPHAEQFDYPTLATDLQEFMEQNWIYKAHLIGHSMGGKTVMQFAVDYPDLVDKLVVVDAAPVKYEGNHYDIFDALLSLDLSKNESRSEIDEALSAKIPEFGVRQFLLKNLKRQKEGYQFKMNLEAIYKNYDNILAGIESGDSFDGDTLFIRGGKSNYVLENHHQAIFDLFPNAKIETVEGAGHWVHADKPKELLELVLNFLEK